MFSLQKIMMTSPNGNIFRVTGHLCAHKGQWRGSLMFSLICVWINGWVNNREAGDLRRYHTHYDVIVMWIWKCLAECRPLCSGLDVLRSFTILQNTQHDKEYSCNFIHVKACRVYYLKTKNTVNEECKTILSALQNLLNRILKCN